MEVFSISQIIETFSVSYDCIRNWEKKGLIQVAMRKGQERYFLSSQIINLVQSVAINRYKTLTLDNDFSFSTIELFSGAGGLALGFKNAGFTTRLLVELNKDAAKTLKQNKPEWNVINDDIKNVSFTGLYADVISGGFPCQAFSVAGKKQGFLDERGTLFFEFLRSIKEVQPKIFVAENVRGLISHNNGNTLNTMIGALEKVGYRVKYRVLRAQFFDVPQKRERLIIIGTRKDLDMPIFFPKEQDYCITLKEALQNVPPSQGAKYSFKKEKVLDLIPEGGCWRNLPNHLQKEYMGKSYYSGGGKTGIARRLSMKEPSLTLTCSPAQKQTERCHPIETRPLTIREYARIQCFPDDWMFFGSIHSQYKQIGNAVPVNLGFHVARSVKAMLKNKFDNNSLISC